MKNKLTLLPRGMLIKTNSVDHADWNYKTVLGYIQRKRFQLVLTLIGNTHFDKILEIGYGSGIFMPALSKYCEQLYGIDIHPFNVEVSNVLDNHGISARLFNGSVSKMPFVNETFDLIISVSTFEFIDDKKSACLEIQRVLKKNGRFIIITPAQSWILDSGFRLLTHENAINDFGNERQRVVPILKEYFTISKSRMFPPVIGNVFPVYKAYVLQLKDGERK